MTDETPKPTEETTATAEAPAETPPEDGDKPAKLKQAVDFRDVGPCKKHIKVTVERSDIDERLDKKYSELVVDANVSGFRPGKAPRRIIERRFKKDVTDQVKAEVLLQSLEQLAEDHDVAPLAAPNINPNKIEIPDSGPFIYEFDVEVRPQFDLPNYKGLRIKREVRKFTDEDVQLEEKRVLEPHGQLVPKPGKDGKLPEVELGDHITADITTKIDDREIGESKEVRIRVDKRVMFRDGAANRFGAQVKGARPGDKREVEVTLSDRVADPSLQGKSVQAVLLIQDVKMVRLPELTHELMHRFGVHSPDQLHELVRATMERRQEYQQRQSARQQVLGYIDAAATWDLPQDLLMRQARSAFGRRIMEMRSAGISEDEIKGRYRLLEQDTLRTTQLALKEHFVLQKVAEVEKLEVVEADLDEEIERIAAQYDESPRRIRARLEKEDLMDALAAEVIENKALDLVLQNADYEDVAVGEAEEILGTVEEQIVAGEMQELPKAPAVTEEEATEGDKPAAP